MGEKLLMKFELNYLQNLGFMGEICRFCWRTTGNKTSIQVNGSKGYLSNIEILCEGYQKQGENIIWIENMITNNGTLKKGKYVYLYHSDDNGMRVLVGGKNEDKDAGKKIGELLSETIRREREVNFNQ